MNVNGTKVLEAFDAFFLPIPLPTLPAGRKKIAYILSSRTSIYENLHNWSRLYATAGKIKAAEECELLIEKLASFEKKLYLR